ncbi:MAG TPA: regulatory protein RecX [Candidatus Eisenbacteria bacterium]|jgi:regulatory protein
MMRQRRRAPPLGGERASDPAAAREAALRLLDRARRTRSDLARRLREKGYAATTIEQVIERLAAVGLMDDVEYARAYLEARLRRRSAGWRRLEQDLRTRGVSSEDVAAARARLEERESGVDELAGARRVIAQAARRYARLEPRLRRQRLYALLARRGFDGDVIEAALREEGGAAER